MDGAVPDKEASELWAFSAAILPMISLCDASVGATLRANADISSATAPMSDGYVAVKTQLESVYACMRITCEQVGGLVDDSGAYLTGFEPCVDSDLDSGDGDSGGDRGITTTGDSDSGDSGLSGGGIAGVTIAVGAVAAAAVVGFVIMKRKNASNKAATVDGNLGGF